MPFARIRVAVPSLFALCFATAIYAAPATPAYTRQEVMIPMRDGVRLHAIVLRPADGSPLANTPLPILIDRTPYGADQATPEWYAQAQPELAAAGYIFVRADIRGRYGSEGKFVMMRPLAAHHDAKAFPKDIDESTDASDTADWLVKNVPHNNGNVGVFGVSYDGFLAMMAGIDPSPAIKAVSPQAPMADVWKGDDFFHNGAFRQSYGYDYALGMESSKENAFGKLDGDAYDYFLSNGSFLADAERAGATALPTWQGFLSHPSYDSYWQARAVPQHLDRVAVPTLQVGGYWDQEDMWGPQAEYAALKQHDTKHEVYLVLGPWNHGEWRREARTLGALDFGTPTGDEFRRQVEVPFFDHYLKGGQTGSDKPFDLKDTASFQTGTNRWMRYNEWPPRQGIEERDLYLASNQGLSFTRPSASSGETTYVSDPAKPIPYRARPIEATYAPTGSHWYEWLAEDQRPSTARADVASWKTPVLDHDVTVTGDVAADIYASTSGTDSDWVVKLIDVYPDDPKLGKMAGYQLMIAEEIFRGRYRKSFTEPQALVPNEVAEYTFSLHGADHVFLKGHRLLVQVQSSWFPLYDRNPQTFVPNIMRASPADYKTATQHIYWSAQYPSHLRLPIVLEARAARPKSE